MAELGDHSEMLTHSSGLIRNETIRRRGWRVMVPDRVLMGDAFFSHAIEPQWIHGHIGREYMEVTSGKHIVVCILDGFST
jgi:hypothetical protein